MIALFTVFEHLSNVRRLLDRFQILWSNRSAPKEKVKNEQFIRSSSIDLECERREILLGPIVENLLDDSRLNLFDSELEADLEIELSFAREIDACLLEVRDIERDLNLFKQRQCSFYEKYLDFVDKKDELIEQFIDYHDEFLKRSSVNYQFNIPVSNRFALLQRENL